MLVTGTYDVKYSNATYNPSKDSDINRGDLIVKINNKTVSKIEDISSCISSIDENIITVKAVLKRNNTSLTRELKFIKCGNLGMYKTGLLVKERILGIGTITYYDPTNNTFGALGHELNDGALTENVDLSVGSIYYSNVVGIKKSIDGVPGEKIAEIDDDNDIGTIFKNNEFGVYGTINNIPNKDSLEAASIDEVTLGEAWIWTVIKGNKIEKFKIKITHLQKQKEVASKGITFEIVDKTLLSKTNGIIAGMSGSPIIQNNKIIGAVTHVLVDNVNKGYGIYIEWMIKENTK